MLRETFDQLFEYIAQHIPSEIILESKKDYQKLTGETSEDDKSHNTRMALFLEWFLLDIYAPGTQNTNLEDIIKKNESVWDQNRLEVCRNITNNIQALFEIKKVRNNSASILNLFTGEKYLIDEGDSSQIFRKNDFFQGRIIPQQGKWSFTGHFCFHPNETHSYIKNEVKNISMLQKSWGEEVKILEKKLFKTGKSRLKNSDDIVQVTRKVEIAGVGSKGDILAEKLLVLREDRENLETSFKQMEIAIAHLKKEKIEFEGRRMVADLINKLACMKLKNERYRNMEIAGIYKN